MTDPVDAVLARRRAEERVETVRRLQREGGGDVTAVMVSRSDEVPAERCAFVYTSYAPAWRDGIPCPFTRDQHPLLHEWFDR